MPPPAQLVSASGVNRLHSSFSFLVSFICSTSENSTSAPHSKPCGLMSWQVLSPAAVRTQYTEQKKADVCAQCAVMNGMDSIAALVYRHGRGARWGFHRGVGKYQGEVFTAADNASDCETPSLSSRELADCILIPGGKQDTVFVSSNRTKRRTASRCGTHIVYRNPPKRQAEVDNNLKSLTVRIIYDLSRGDLLVCQNLPHVRSMQALDHAAQMLPGRTTDAIDELIPHATKHTHPFAILLMPSSSWTSKAAVSRLKTVYTFLIYQPDPAV